MSTTSNPFTALESTIDRLTRQFEETARNLERGEEMGLQAFGFETVAADVMDREDEFVVTVDLPGFEREEIDVRIAGRMLSITAEHDEETEMEEVSYLKRERYEHSMKRTVKLPAEIDDTGVFAKLDKGVLTITVPKAEPTEREHTIEIN